MDRKAPRKDLFWFVYRIVVGVFAVFGIALLVWLGITLDRYQAAEDRRKAVETPVVLAATPTPSPLPSIAPTVTPDVAPTPEVTVTPVQTPVPTADPLFKETEPRVRALASEVTAFISGEKAFGDISRFFIDGTRTKNTLRNFVNEYYIHLTSYELSQWRISEWTLQENGDLSCRVRFTLTAYWHDRENGTDAMDYRMTLRKVRGEWLIYELTL